MMFSCAWVSAGFMDLGSCLLGRRRRSILIKKVYVGDVYFYSASVIKSDLALSVSSVDLLGMRQE
jgi:hypothetical protein